jgi:hypothetical protein
MKRILYVSVVLLAGILGCHSSPAQVPPGPTTYTCPPATVGGTAYTPLNPATNTANPPVAAAPYNDTPGIGTWCYTGQAWLSPNSSAPSNVVMPTTTAALPVVQITWTNPTQTESGVTYVISRAPAIANAPLTAPAINPASVIAQNAAPAETRAGIAGTGERILQPGPSIAFALLSKKAAR